MSVITIPWRWVASSANSHVFLASKASFDTRCMYIKIYRANMALYILYITHAESTSSKRQKNAVVQN